MTADPLIMRTPRGKKPKVSPEIHRLCADLATKRWSAPKIAEYLKDKHGICNSNNPEEPVPRNTIGRWIERGSEEISKTEAYRRDVQQILAVRGLDALEERFHELADNGLVEMTLEEWSKYSAAVLPIIRERSLMLGLYAPKRKEVEVTQVEGGVPRKKLNKKAEYNQADFERWIQKNGKGRT